MYQRYCISYIFQIFSHRISTFHLDVPKNNRIGVFPPYPPAIPHSSQLRCSLSVARQMSARASTAAACLLPALSFAARCPLPGKCLLVQARQPLASCQLSASLFAIRCPANVCSCKHGSRLPLASSQLRCSLSVARQMSARASTAAACRAYRTKKREALQEGLPASVVYLCSLRWHYPNQVAGRSDSSSSQPA